MTTLPTDGREFDARVRAVVDARLRGLVEFMSDYSNGLSFDEQPTWQDLATLIERFIAQPAPARQDAQAPTAEAREWQHGDMRCDACDNGIDEQWMCCPWCGIPLQEDHEQRRAAATPPASPTAPAPSGVAGEDGPTRLWRSMNCLDIDDPAERAEAVMRQMFDGSTIRDTNRETYRDYLLTHFKDYAYRLTEARAANDAILLQLAEALAARDAATDALRRMRDAIRNAIVFRDDEGRWVIANDFAADILGRALATPPAPAAAREADPLPGLERARELWDAWRTTTKDEREFEEVLDAEITTKSPAPEPETAELASGDHRLSSSRAEGRS